MCWLGGGRASSFTYSPLCLSVFALCPFFRPAVSLSIPKTDPAIGKHPHIFGGKLENEYELEGLHFHWGDKNNRGAEHVLNDIR